MGCAVRIACLSYIASTFRKCAGGLETWAGVVGRLVLAVLAQALIGRQHVAYVSSFLLVAEPVVASWLERHLLRCASATCVRSSQVEVFPYGPDRTRLRSLRGQQV